ncbi:MAG: hypothetical protein LBU99_06305 [Spirochaetaceae bacterium]|jgi:hypothetical protein|nr:hypothetical protein [Spirochaetaceae bacterium]
MEKENSAVSCTECISADFPGADFIAALCKLSAVSDLLSHYAPDEALRVSETCGGLACIIDDAVIQLSLNYEYLTKDELSDG